MFTKPLILWAETKYFEQVIVTGMSGSSWKFRRFVMITLKVLNLVREIVK